MSIKLDLPKLAALRPRIMVIGVGGAGGNAVNNMILSGLNGVDFVVANTDAQALQSSSAEQRIQLGVHLTEGLGAGSRPEIGEAAAEEAIEDIREQIANSHMLFIAAGMGGGTGTGAAAVIARIAKEAGVLTVGIVTRPFQFEGARRARIAEAGIAELKKYVDTLIVIPNQNLFRIANEKTTFAEAFVLADQVLYSGIACIVDLIIKDGLINLDFADVRTVLKDMGTAVMGTGEGEGERRASQAAEEAISNPLLDDVSLKGARGLLLSITGGRDLTLYEVDEAASRVRQEVDAEANIIVGATFDDTLGDRVRVSIVASGMQRKGETASAPKRLEEDAAEPAAAPAPAPASSAPAQAPAAALAPAAPARIEAPSVSVAPPQPALTPAPMFTPPATGGAAPAALRAEARASVEASDADDLSRRLSAAFDYDAMDGGGAAAIDADEAFAADATIAGEPWRAPGDVMIEETPQRPVGGMMRGVATPPPMPVRATPPPPPVSRGAEAFEPAPTQDIRRSQRRMPELEDFPPIGQREYQSKAGAQQVPPALPPAPPHARDGYAQPAESRRKPGLLARLTGRGRGESDSQAGDRGHPPADWGARQPAGSDRGQQPRDASEGRGGGRRR